MNTVDPAQSLPFLAEHDKKHSKEKYHLVKLKYLGAILFHTLLAGLCITNNPGAPFIIHDVDWPYQRYERSWMFASTMQLRL